MKEFKICELQEDLESKQTIHAKQIKDEQSWKSEKVRLFQELEQAQENLIYEQANMRAKDRQLEEVRNAYEELKQQNDLYKKLQAMDNTVSWAQAVKQSQPLKEQVRLFYDAYLLEA